VEIRGLTYDQLVAEFSLRYEKGEYHAGALFRQVHGEGKLDPFSLPAFAKSQSLAAKVMQDFYLPHPEFAGRKGDGDTYKFLLKLSDGLEAESVVIPMRRYKTLCVSSQVGCKMGCRFCETAQMGFVRQLSAAEMVAQVHAARFELGEPIENLVFMGMGEPLDNLDALLPALNTLADQRGINIPPKSITVSTVGHVDGLRKLAEVARVKRPQGLWHLRLAVSLNAPNDALRRSIMPITDRWNLADLKAVLREWPFHGAHDFIFMEYVLLRGVNDGPEHAAELVEWLSDLPAVVNLIPYNPRLESPYDKPERGEVERFWSWLMTAGQATRIRGTKGDEAMAACGQLGNRSFQRRRKDVS
jgi:23S rRNA (adenine2503-C2)-methyltransferase